MRVGKDDTRVQLFYLYDTMFVPWLVRINRLPRFFRSFFELEKIRSFAKRYFSCLPR